MCVCVWAGWAIDVDSAMCLSRSRSYVHLSSHEVNWWLFFKFLCHLTSHPEIQLVFRCLRVNLVYIKLQRKTRCKKPITDWKLSFNFQPKRSLVIVFILNRASLPPPLPPRIKENIIYAQIWREYAKAIAGTDCCFQLWALKSSSVINLFDTYTFWSSNSNYSFSYSWVSDEEDISFYVSYLFLVVTGKQRLWKVRNTCAKKSS